jgi:hypothetical protein
VVRPTVSHNQARVLGVVLGVSGFAFASVSGLAASHVAADSKIADNKVWVTAKGSDAGPPAGDFVRVISDCKDVSVWGNDLHNKSGEFTVYFDDHDGKDRQVEDMTWKFDKGGKDKQVIATIDARELISDLKDKGFTAQDNGWHIDLKFKDPEREVEFILDNSCKSESGGGGGGGEQTPTPTETTPTPVIPTPPAPVKAVSAQAPKAAAVPQTGADAPFLTGMALMSMGGAALGFARKLGGRKGL